MILKSTRRNTGLLDDAPQELYWGVTHISWIKRAALGIVIAFIVLISIGYITEQLERVPRR